MVIMGDAWHDQFNATVEANRQLKMIRRWVEEVERKYGDNVQVEELREELENSD